MIEFSSFFSTHYPPERPRLPISEALASDLQQRLPPKLLTLMQQQELGKHRQGMFELINPQLYREVYAGFLGGDAGRRVPFLMNAFGELVACRPLPGHEVEISMLHPYGPRLDVVAMTLDDFFERVLGSDDGLLDVVNVQLFNDLRVRHPRLLPGEIYGFDPAVLAAEQVKRVDASYFQVLGAPGHLALLLKRAEEED